MKYSIEKVLSQGVCLGKIHKIEINDNIVDSSDYEKLNKAIEKSVSQIREMIKGIENKNEIKYIFEINNINTKESFYFLCGIKKDTEGQA